MSVWMIIVGGIVIISVAGVFGDMVTKIAQSKARDKESKGAVPVAEIEEMKGRIASLESRLEEREDSVRKLQDEVRFVSRMLEDKTGGAPRN
jgi:hypothetical protein